MGSVNKVIGVCRFSYLGESGFQLLKQNPKDAETELYAADRMERRFAYFENICLPSLAAQTDRDFVLVALIGDTMPAKHRSRLKRLIDAYPFLRIATLESTGPLHASRRAFWRGLDDQDADFITGFRIDDDDAVARDYVEKTRAIAGDLIAMGWATAETPAAICFHRGLYWDMKRTQSAFWDVREIQPLGLASAMVSHPESRHNIYRWNHRKLTGQARCWIDPHDPMFIRTLHNHNDSVRTKIPSDAEQLSAGDAVALLRDRFGLDPDQLLPLMAKLHAGDADAPGAVRDSNRP